MRTCTRCGEAKPATKEFFYENPRSRGGLAAICRTCIIAAVRAHRRTDHAKAVAKSYRARSDIREIDRTRDRLRKRVRNDETKEKARIASARYRSTKNGKVKLNAFKRRYNGRPEVKARVAEIERQKRASNPTYRITQGVSAVIRSALAASGDYKARRPWWTLVGYTAEELARHLERQFVKGMGWNNMGEWHIDHIVPLVTFKFTSANDPEFKAAWALTNLRPLWSKANRSKGARRTLLI